MKDVMPLATAIATAKALKCQSQYLMGKGDILNVLVFVQPTVQNQKFRLQKLIVELSLHIWGVRTSS